jgi:ribosomal protein S18 acetylase RimI-like enzyme
VISLRPLKREEADLVADISLRPDQLQFAGTVQEALAEPAERFDLHLICQNDRPVGIFKIDRSYASDYPFAGVKDLGLRAVIIDHPAQGKGIGKAAMSKLADYLPTHYADAQKVWLTVNMTNPTAIATYQAAKFTSIDDIWHHGTAGPQYIMYRSLR